MWVRVAITIVLLLLPTALHAQAEKRIALLIGNKDYKAGVGALTNPLNDIRIVGEALKTVGFEVLKPVENAQRSAMLIAIHAFAAKLKAAGPNAVGFLYYSGHGIASAGENYLIPTDVDEPSTVQLSVQGVKQSEVLGILRGEAPNAAHYLVLDACRHTLQGARGGKGFVPVGQQSGVLVAFAAEPGKTASDIGQGSGPYAAALATELVKPGQSDLIMFHQVRVAVMDKTKGDQVPWTEDGIQRRQRVLFGGEGRANRPPMYLLSEAGYAWDRAKDGTSVTVLEAFIARYKDTFYADLARARIADLKKQQCESYSERNACDLDTSCSWDDSGKRCQRKKTQPGAPCEGIEALVGNERRCLKPKDSFKDCPDCPEMVVVTGGRFMMGSPATEIERHFEEEQHQVVIPKAFAVGKFEITFAEWDACVLHTGCTRQTRDFGWGRGRRPVVDVSWNDAKQYVVWMSRRTGHQYSLLTEAEWEYAARAGTTTPFSMGHTITTDQANFNGSIPYGDSPAGRILKRTVEVGSFKPNGFGLHDMHGNVWEWVEDCYEDGYIGAPTDGSARLSGNCRNRGVRSGAYVIGGYGLRSAFRAYNDSDHRSEAHGFRVARAL